MGAASKDRLAEEYAASVLRLIDLDMQRNPQMIRPLDEDLVREIASLVDGVEVDRHEDIGAEIQL